jgi:polysaccharide pyruvyl transferase CsaB
MTNSASTGSHNDSGQASIPLRVLVSGFYGYNNLGDEAILESIVQQVKGFAPDAQIVALSGSPLQTKERLGIESVHRMAFGAIWAEMRKADLFISGGGSLLQDVTGLGSVPYYLGLVKMAQTLGVKTMFLGQGIGPLTMPHSRWMVGAVARGTDVLTVRDQASRELLARCGVPMDRITQTADPVLALEPAPDAEIDALWAELGLDPNKPTLGIAIRPWSDWFERQLKSFSAVLAQEATQWGAQILLLPFHRPDDELLMEELSYCLETRPEEHRPKVAMLKDSVSPRVMMGLLARLDLLVGMRLHALIMGAAVAVPSIGLVYDPKVRAFADLAGFPTIESVTALEDSDHIVQVLDSVWANRQAMRESLLAKRDTWRRTALQNAELAVQLGRSAHARRH